MDWKTLRRDRLAKAALYNPSARRDGVWWGALDRAADWWGRFTSLSWWEKGMVIGTGVLFAVLTPMAAFALAGGDGSQPALAPPPPTSAIVAEAGPSATPSPRPTITPKPVPNTATPTTTPELIRQDCDELRAANDGSPEEQRWFLENCELEADPTPVQKPPASGPARSPAAPAAPPAVAARPSPRPGPAPSRPDG